MSLPASNLSPATGRINSYLIGFTVCVLLVKISCNHANGAFQLTVISLVDHESVWSIKHFCGGVSFLTAAFIVGSSKREFGPPEIIPGGGAGNLLLVCGVQNLS